MDTQYFRGPLPAYSPACGVVIIFYFSRSDRCAAISHDGFNLCFLMVDDAEDIFCALLFPLHVLFGTMSLHVSYPFSNGFVFLLGFEILQVH